MKQKTWNTLQKYDAQFKVNLDIDFFHYRNIPRIVMSKY